MCVSRKIQIIIQSAFHSAHTTPLQSTGTFGHWLHERSNLPAIKATFEDVKTRRFSEDPGLRFHSKAALYMQAKSTHQCS